MITEGPAGMAGAAGAADGTHSERDTWHTLGRASAARMAAAVAAAA